MNQFRQIVCAQAAELNQSDEVQKELEGIRIISSNQIKDNLHRPVLSLLYYTKLYSSTMVDLCSIAMCYKFTITSF